MSASAFAGVAAKPAPSAAALPAIATPVLATKLRREISEEPSFLLFIKFSSGNKYLTPTRRIQA
jgi:hypothetical protein